MMLRLSLFAAAVALTTALAPAQFALVSGSFAPNPAPPGATITLTCRDAAGTGLNLSSPCGWYTIHSGSQTGPVVPLATFCTQNIVPIAAHGSFSASWDQLDSNGQQVPAGTYWWQVRTWDAALQTLRTEWFCISIQGPTAPALSAGGPARVGQVMPMQIQAPLSPGAAYFVGLSFSANTPATVFGLQACISDPVIFDFLVAPFGGLDATGLSSGLALAVPNTPVALWQGAHMQALLIGSGPMQLTNSIAISVGP